MKIYVGSTKFLTDENMDRYLQEVCNKRKEKIKRVKNIDDKKRSLLAGLLLRMALANEGIEYDDSIFSVDANKKPYIINHANIFYNLSHSGDYAVVAISDSEVGVDVEKIEGYNFKVAKRCFTEKEFLYIEKENENKKAELYTTIWTLKESYLKATGEGIRRELNSFDTTFTKKDAALVRDDYRTAYIKILRDIEGYAISICSFKEIDNIQVVMADGKEFNT